MRSPLRIALVCLHTSPGTDPGSGDAGGMNVVVRHQAEQLAALGHRVTILTRRSAADQPESQQLAEGLTLGRAGGLDWRDMWAVLSASAVASPIVKAKGVQLAERDFTPTFTVPQMLKDLDLITAAAATHRVSLPQTTLTQALMHTAIAQGDAAPDYAAIIRAVERSAGLTSEIKTSA